MLRTGDLFVAYKDGITETMNQADEEWGEENFIRTVEACEGFAPRQIYPARDGAADAFAAGASQHDDMTLVVLRLIAE